MELFLNYSKMCNQTAEHQFQLWLPTGAEFKDSSLILPKQILDLLLCHKHMPLTISIPKNM